MGSVLGLVGAKYGSFPTYWLPKTSLFSVLPPQHSQHAWKDFIYQMSSIGYWIFSCFITHFIIPFATQGWPISRSAFLISTVNVMLLRWWKFQLIKILAWYLDSLSNGGLGCFEIWAGKFGVVLGQPRKPLELFELRKSMCYVPSVPVCWVAEEKDGLYLLTLSMCQVHTLTAFPPE